jgi:cellulose synthase/poly-beta-1,6-N-acetylglucosamine synthase-like glycosyltransferase
MRTAAILLFWVSAGLIAYSYLLYPLLLGIAAKVIGRPVRRDDSYLPTVAFLVPAYNEERVITAKIRNILSLEYPPERLTVVIGSDKSTDGTNELVREYQKSEPRVKLWVATHRCGKTGILNELASTPR